jgi:ubiquinone/menaquinone biosynthesis C-methylase UbiE
MADGATKQVGQMGSYAPFYDLIMTVMTFGREANLRRRTVELARLEPGHKVLEIGCGTGSLTIAAKRRVGASGEVVGMDIAPEMVAAATRKEARRGAGVTFRVGSIADIPFPDDRFDVLMFSFMIFHMPDEVRLKGLAESHRVLKPGGHVFVLDAALPEKARRRRGALMMHDVRELAPALERQGFTEIEMQDSGFSFLGTRFWSLRARAEKPRPAVA